MVSDSLIHDVAWATALHILEIFAPCLQEEEKHDAFSQVYAAVKAGLECFQLRENRRQSRLRPGSN